MKNTKVKSILVCQPKPETERSPYFELAKKYNLKIDFRPFIEVHPLSPKEFRAQKINDWNNQKLINYILNNNDWSGFYAIKLVGFNRKAINDKNSFIQKLNSL